MIGIKENEKQMKMQKDTVRKKEHILAKTMNKIKTEVVRTGI